MFSRICPAWMSNAQGSKVSLPHWRGGSKSHPYFECAGCGSAWWEVRPEEGVYEMSKQNSARDKTSSFIGLISRMNRFFLGRVVGLITSSHNLGDPVLDIGCGRGKLI